MRIDVDQYTRIPSLPTVAIEVLRVFQDPDSSLDDVIRIVRNDPGIVSKLLKAANSPVYLGRGDITDLKRAVLLLGRNTVTPLVLSFSLAQQSTEGGAFAEYFGSFWLRSFVQATAAELLAAQFGSPAFRGECYTTNLLAGIGKLALLRAEPERYLSCLNRWHADQASLRRIEVEELGFTHAELSGELLQRLGLPARCVKAIRLLDDPGAAIETEGLPEPLEQISQVADAVASMLCDRIPGVAVVALEESLAGLTLPSPLTSEALLQQVQARVAATAGLFDLNPPQMPSPGEMLQEALEQLAGFAVLAASPQPERSVPQELMEENGRLRRRVADLLRSSRVDVLTGAFNRGWFLNQLAERIALHRVRQQSLGLAVVDIDHFKSFNDAHGHLAGDLVLKAVAETLQQCLREGDVLGRYGGEEFVILMEDADTTILESVGERLRDRIAGLSIHFEGQELAVTVSIGLSASPVIGDEEQFARSLFAAADAGMYRAKNSGRNRFFVEPCTPDETQRISVGVGGTACAAENRMSAFQSVSHSMN